MNRYVILGLILSILGVILIPFIVGIPIAGIGLQYCHWGNDRLRSENF